MVPENPTADAQHQPSMAPYEQLEGSGVPVHDEPSEQFGVGRLSEVRAEGSDNAGGRM
jgi:hypothetical protein